VNVTTPSASVRPRATGHAQAHSKEYETIYVLRSDVDAEAAERVQGRVGEAIEREHGKLVKVEAWGRRRLAYPVGKQRRGVYVYLKYVGGGGLVAEVERNLKLQDAVMKFMTVQTNDDVDLGALQVDPEETKLGKLELPPEEDKEDSREKQLGLVDMGPDAPRSMRAPDEGDEFESEGAEPGEAGEPEGRESGKPGEGEGGGSGGGSTGGSEGEEG
jgi:small subunit ribosomal protein S6